MKRSRLTLAAVVLAGALLIAAVHVVAVGSAVGVIGRLAVLSGVGLLAVVLVKRYAAETAAGA